MAHNRCGKCTGVRGFRALLCVLLLVMGAATARAQFQPNPVVTAISPASVTQGNPGFSITVTGSNFAPGASVAVGDGPVPTAFVSSNELIGTVPASFLTVPSQVVISVIDPGNLGSNQLLLTVVPAPQIVSDTPQDVNAGSPGFTLTVVGSQFVPGCGIRIGSMALSTTFISANELSAFVPASLLSSSGRFDVVVAAPDGPVSNKDVLIVEPVLTSLGSIQVSGSLATINVTGVGFVQDDVVDLTVNGMVLQLPTAFISSTLLRATLTSQALQIGHGSINVAEPSGADSMFVPFSLPLMISSFSPGGAFALEPSFNLIVSGGIFPPGSLVLWNGAPLTTTVVSLNQLTASVPSSLLVNSGVVDIQVLQPGGATVSMPYAVNSGLTIFGVTFASAAAGGTALTMTVNGAGFLAGATVQWNGAPLATTFVNSGEVTAVAPANLIAAGTAEIVVVDPGGARSNAIPLSITVAVVAAGGITGLNPPAAVAGGPSLVLTVQGFGFRQTSVVNFNGTPLTTTFVSSTQLVATVPAGLIGVAGAASVTVNSGAAVSSAATFAILNGPPLTSSAAVVNLGNDASSIAPGSLISVYGSGLATGSMAASGTPLPNQLNGTSLIINGIQAPLFYVSPSQINAQVPFEAPVGLATLVVSIGGVPSAPVIFQLQGVGPGVWSYPGTSNTLAVNDTDGTLVTPSNPVSPGTYVTVYLTGQGAVMNPISTGAAAAQSPLSTPAGSISVTVGGASANSASALAPGLVGVLQVNIQVPAVAAGNQPLVVTVGGVPSNTTSLPIAAH